MSPRKTSWQIRKMTADEYEAMIGRLGMNVAQAGRFLGISERTSHRYIRGEAEIPIAHALLLRAMWHFRAEPEVPPWVSDRR